MLVRARTRSGTRVRSRSRSRSGLVRSGRGPVQDQKSTRITFSAAKAPYEFSYIDISSDHCSAIGPHLGPTRAHRCPLGLIGAHGAHGRRVGRGDPAAQGPTVGGTGGSVGGSGGTVSRSGGGPGAQGLGDPGAWGPGGRTIISYGTIITNPSICVAYPSILVSSFCSKTGFLY